MIAKANQQANLQSERPQRVEVQQQQQSLSVKARSLFRTCADLSVL